MKRLSAIICVPLALMLAAGPGCIYKSIGVRSDPPGALVYLDGLEVGQTPVDHIPFDFYGTREIALYKHGFQVERRIVEIDTPWYSWFPFDIVSELIIPWDIPDRRQYYFAMQPSVPVDTGVLLRNAEETREVAIGRIEAERAASSYKPRPFVIQRAATPSFFWGPFVQPPRVEPTYKNYVTGEQEPVLRAPEPER